MRTDNKEMSIARFVHYQPSRPKASPWPSALHASTLVKIETNDITTATEYANKKGS